MFGQLVDIIKLLKLLATLSIDLTKTCAGLISLFISFDSALSGYIKVIFVKSSFWEPSL
jgi:hypothetical protein